MSLPSFFIPPAPFERGGLARSLSSTGRGRLFALVLVHTPGPFLFSYPRPLHTPRLRRTPLGKGTEGWRGWSLALFHTHFSSSYPPASPDPFGKGMGTGLAFVVFCGGIFNYWRELFIFAVWPGWPGFNLTDLK